MTEKAKMSSSLDWTKDMEEERVRHRLLALEKETEKLRARLRLLGFGLLASLGLAVVAAFGQGLLHGNETEVRRDILRVRQLVLEDQEGKSRGLWTVDEEGNSRLSILDRQGNARLNVSVLGTGFPGISLTNGSGQTRAALGLLPDESANLVFADGAGTPRTVLGLSRADASHLVFADAEGEARVDLGLEANGEGSVILPGEIRPGVPNEGGR